MKKSIKVAVIGGRDFSDYDRMKIFLDRIKNDISLIVSGGAIGADSLGENWAKENNIPTKIFYPDWARYGKRAGFIRNEYIIDEADIVYAFWDGKSKGTKNSIDIAKKKHKEIVIIKY